MSSTPELDLFGEPITATPASANSTNSNQPSERGYKAISAAAKELDVATHVLRFWESKFPQLQPIKKSGRRYYGPEHMALLKRIKTLLHEQGYTIKGVQGVLKKPGVVKEAKAPTPVAAAEPLPLDKWRKDLEQARKLLSD